ncbi:MAG: glycosyltransferase family 39 protein [Candidatus Omnitrophica bacterium]|nr:glycosyltransferase family 39 protein [Candidatus Omnitrophota bacterium]
MNDKKEISSNKPYTTAFMVLSVILLIYITFRHILSSFFTSSDIFSLIELYQIKSLKDVFNIFTKPLLADTSFQGVFLRPVAGIFFSLEYYIWGLNPFGYHLTDMLIHILTSILVFFIAMKLTGGRRSIAWISAIVFAVHPTNRYTVLLIDTREDTLSTLFLALSFLSFLKYLPSRTYRKGLLIASLFFYVLASGSKEVAIILPFLVLVYLIIFSDEESAGVRIVRALKIVAPYVLLTILIFSWRQYLLGHAARGYYGYKLNPDDIIVLKYFDYLIDPISLFKSFYFYNKQIVYFIPLIPLLISSLLYKKILLCGRGIKLIIIFLIAVVILSSCAIFAYPLIEQISENAYYGKGPKPLLQFFKWLMQGREHPLINFLEITRLFLLNVFYSLLFFFTLFLVVIANYGSSGKSIFPVLYKNKLKVFLLIWILLPLCIYVAISNFVYCYLYNPLVPLSIILSVIFIEWFETPYLKPVKRLFGMGIFILSVLMCSYVIIDFNLQLKDSMRKRELFLMKILKVLPELSNNVTINIENYPKNFVMPNADSIKSWLNLNSKTNYVKKVNINTGPPAFVSREALDFVMIKDDNQIKLNVITKSLRMD